MHDRLLGALKAAAPTLLSLTYIAVDAVFGTPVDISQLKALVVGLITSVVVWFVPNLATGGPQESAAAVKIAGPLD